MGTDPADREFGYRTELRKGGWLGIADDDLIVAREDDPAVRVALDDIEEVTRQQFDWFTIVLGLAIVGFGIYQFGPHPLGSLAFVAFGVVTLLWAYRTREEMYVRVVNRPEPLVVYPTDANEFYDAVGEALHGDATSAAGPRPDPGTGDTY